MTNSMIRGYRMMIAGLLLTAIHVHYMNIQILPSLFGNLLLFLGLICILRVKDTHQWRQAKKATTVLLLISFLELLQPIAIPTEAIPSPVVLLWAVLKLVFILLMVCGILAGSVEWLRDIDKDELAKKYEKKMRVYITLFLIVTLGDIGVIVCSSELGSIIIAGAFMALQIWLAAKMYGLQKAISGVTEVIIQTSQQERELAESGAKSK